MNALCALATAYALKLDLDALLPAFATMQESDGRGRKHQLAHAGSEICLIDDSYNASPASIQAALDAVASYDARHLLIIFSDMLELGEAGLDEHLRLAPAIEAAGAKSGFGDWPAYAGLLCRIARNHPDKLFYRCRQPACLSGGRFSQADRHPGCHPCQRLTRVRCL